MELTKFKFIHTSCHSPLLKVLVDGLIYFNSQLNTNDPIEFHANLDDGPHLIEIVHYGKNYISDGERSFELTDFLINDLSIKTEIHKFVQYPDLPPWDEWHVNNQLIRWEDNLHLGHNGKLVYTGFSTPYIDWRKSTFVNVKMPTGMQTSAATLELSKKFLEEQLKKGMV